MAASNGNPGAGGAEASAAVAPLKAHPAAELLPRPTADELDKLAADIKANGLIHPIIVISPDGERLVLDGLSRGAALESLGITVGPEHMREIAAPADPVGYVLSANLHRRHLSSEQKRELAAKVLKFRPERSDRQVAALVGISDKTVGSVRTDLEANAEIPHKHERADRRRPWPQSNASPGPIGDLPRQSNSGTPIHGC
jgi:hypothetical protein